MSSIDKAQIEAFLHGQVECWNQGDREGFFDHYKAVAPASLTIEYVGRPAADGWPILEAMWEQQNAKMEIDEVISIVNGPEAVCHNRNKARAADMAIETIELYRFDAGGHLTVRYFISQP